MIQDSSVRQPVTAVTGKTTGSKKLTASNKFKDKIKSVVVFKELHHVENIVRLLTLMINFDLAMNLKYFLQII